MHIRCAVPGSAAAANKWSRHASSLNHLRLLSIPFLRCNFGIVLERSNLGPDQIDVGHRTWSRSGPAESFRFEHVRVKVSIKVISSFASFEDEENNQYQGEDTDGSADDTTRDGSGVRRRGCSATRGLRWGREDELGGLHSLRFNIAVRIGGSGNHVGKKESVITPDLETKGTYTMTVLNTEVDVEVDVLDSGSERVPGDGPWVVVDDRGVPEVSVVGVVGVVVGVVTVVGVSGVVVGDVVGVVTVVGVVGVEGGVVAAGGDVSG